MELVMYAREQHGVKVEARQRLENGKYVYEIFGFVNGEQVKHEVAEGYRFVNPKARAMFKELYAEFAPASEKKQSASAKMTPEEKEAAMAKRMQERIAKQEQKKEEKLAEAIKRKEEAAAKRAAAKEAAAKEDAVEGDGTASAPKKKGRKVYSVAEGAVVTDPN